MGDVFVDAAVFHSDSYTLKNESFMAILLFFRFHASCNKFAAESIGWASAKISRKIKS
jgi:hypothetical protein